MFLSLALMLNAQQASITKLYNQAQVAETMGNLDDAIELYGKILKIDPQFARGYLALGNVYVKKGQDVNSLQNAILNFTEYLRLNPNAENSEDVQTSLDKLEYILEKSEQRESNHELLLGRWASTDGKYDKYGRSLFILDIKEFDDKLQISIEPSSLAYSDEFFSKTVYIDDPSANAYAVNFTNDKNYMPSQAKYAFNSEMISNVSSQLGSFGGVANAVGQFLNSSAQEKDLQKKTLTSFELKINPIPDENKKLKCFVRISIKEATPLKEQMVLDTVMVDELYKVSNDFQNAMPLAYNYGNMNVSAQKYNPFDKTTQNTKSMSLFNSSNYPNKQGINLSNYPNKQIANLYKSGKTQTTIGTVFTACGAGILGLGLGFALADAIDDDPNKSSISSAPFVITGGVLTVIGLPLMFTGAHSTKKAIKLYNEDLEKRRGNTSELKIGLTGNGVGLALTF